MSNTPNYLLGAQGAPSDATQVNALDFIITQMMNKRLHMELVRVEACTNEPGTLGGVGRVDVTPLVSMLDGFGNAIPHTVVYGLSYFRYAGGQNAIILDPQPGDFGFAVIADKDTSVVRSTLAEGPPGSLGRSRREYGVYVGLCLGNATITNSIRFTPTGIVITTGTDGLTINANVVINDGNVTVNDGSVAASSDVIGGNGGAQEVSLLTHLHSEAGGVGPSGPPIPVS